MKDVLIVRSNPISPRVKKEAVSLIRGGYTVSLLCWNRDPDNEMNYFNGTGINIIQFRYKAPYGKFIVGILWIFWWSKILQHLYRHRYSVVHVCGLDCLPPVILSRSVIKYTIIYDIFDFFGESMPANTPKIIRWSISTLERVLSRFVDCVILVDESRVSQLGGARLRHVEIIMNCVEDSSAGRLEALEKSRDFTIFYGGMISKTRGLVQLAEAIDGMSGVRAIIAGRGEDEIELAELFQNIPNITYLGHLSLEKTIEYTFYSDVIFGFYDPIIPNNRLASPNKLFEAMMCGTPIIVNQETSMAEIVKNEICGIITAYDDLQAVRRAIHELKTHPELCTELGNNGRAAYEREFNWKEMERRLLKIYSRYA